MISTILSAISIDCSETSDSCKISTVSFSDMFVFGTSVFAVSSFESITDGVSSCVGAVREISGCDFVSDAAIVFNFSRNSVMMAVPFSPKKFNQYSNVGILSSISDMLSGSVCVKYS